MKTTPPWFVVIGLALGVLLAIRDGFPDPVRAVGVVLILAAIAAGVRETSRRKSDGSASRATDS